MDEDELADVLQQRAADRGVELEASDAASLLEALLDALGGALEEGESVDLPGLGRLTVESWGGRSGFDPRNEDETIGIPKSSTLRLEPLDDADFGD